MNQRIKIFTHGSDIDGLGNVVLGKLAFGDIEYELFPDPQDLKVKFQKYIEEGILYVYDQIYITDLALYPPAVEMVNEDAMLRDRVIVFDHHKGAIDAKCGIYDFTHVIIVDENGKKRCGTELFYDYLCQNGFINKSPLLDSFVELVRLEDTWEWVSKDDFGIMAHDLATLFNSLTREEYVSRMINKLSSSNETEFYFDDFEKQLIFNKKEECNKAVAKALEEMEYFVDELENKFGIVFTNYEFRNDIPEYVRSSGNPEGIKYIIIVAMDKGENGQKSYRRVENDVDVNEIAKLHGGGGHVSAAAVAITAKQKEEALKLPKRDGLKYLAKCVYDG